MAQTACEMMWLKSLLVELGFVVKVPIQIHCNNQTAIFIVNNPTFHAWTKHIEVDCHYVCDMVMRGIVATPYTPSSKQLADIFTKDLGVVVFESLSNKLDMTNIYAPT